VLNKLTSRELDGAEHSINSIEGGAAVQTENIRHFKKTSIPFKL
jgi:hypothetical protein